MKITLLKSDNKIDNNPTTKFPDTMYINHSKSINKIFKCQENNSSCQYGFMKLVCFFFVILVDGILTFF